MLLRPFLNDAGSCARYLFGWASLRNPVLRACSQAGLVNNLNDALVWGLVPLYLAARYASVREIAVVAASCPVVWGADATSPRAAIAIVAALTAASGVFFAVTTPIERSQRWRVAARS
jgi:hypothetical protein